MSAIDAYLTDLGSALGERLPPDLEDARLREARGHLLASAEEVGEAEAVRRYGRPRVVANGLVRVHRGYDARSVWSLILPLNVVHLAFWYAFGFVPLYLNDGMPILDRSWSLMAVIAFYLAFAVRVVQTRRWLVGPVFAFMVLSAVITTAVRHAYPVGYVSGRENGQFYRRRMTSNELAQHYARVPDWGTPRVWLHEASYAIPGLAINGGIWLVLNTAALGLAALSDRRRVRRA